MNPKVLYMVDRAVSKENVSVQRVEFVNDVECYQDTKYCVSPPDPYFLALLRTSFARWIIPCVRRGQVTRNSSVLGFNKEKGHQGSS